MKRTASIFIGLGVGMAIPVWSAGLLSISLAIIFIGIGAFISNLS